MEPVERPSRTDQDGALAQAILSDIQRHVRLPPNVTPAAALSAVMCTFSLHVEPGEARHIFDALPKALHPLLGRCMRHRGEHAARFDRDELARRVARHLDVSTEDAEEIVTAVLTAVSAALPAREVSHVASQLPPDLRQLWVARTPSTSPDSPPHPILERVEDAVSLPRGITAARALLTVMCTLSRALGYDEARQLVGELRGALPNDVQPFLQECLDNRGAEPERFDRGELVKRVATELNVDAEAAAPIARAVLRAVRPNVRPGLAAHVSAQLPEDLRELWSAP